MKDVVSTVREATIEDVPVMFEIRLSVRENTATRQQLEKHGIDEAFVAAAIRAPGRGWIAEESGRSVGFCIADREGADLMALFVLPEFEGRGHGAKLLDTAVRWLFSEGVQRVTLATGPGTRSHHFYLKRGWIETGRIEPNGDLELELTHESRGLRCAM
jgi:GNAT superfamily N-acetyltransferase